MKQNQQYKVYIEHCPSQQSQAHQAAQQFQVSVQDNEGQPLDFNQQVAAPNLSILVKDTCSHEEWTGSAFLNENFIDRLQKWVAKGKYTCTKFTNELSAVQMSGQRGTTSEIEDRGDSVPPQQAPQTEMELRVQIFKFQLHRLERSTLMQIKCDISQFKRENERLRGELKLFRYYFLNLWKERQSRYMINQPENDALRQSVVASTNRLWDGVSASGLILEEFGAKTYYLAFQTIDHSAVPANLDPDSSSYEGHSHQALVQQQNQVEEFNRESRMGTTGEVNEMYDKQFQVAAQPVETKMMIADQKNSLA